MASTLVRTSVALLGTGAVALAACGGDDGGPAEASSSPNTSAVPVIEVADGRTYDPDVDPTDFVDRIDNTYFPLLPGASWVYEGTADGESERIEVVVTDETRTVMDVEATVVRDTVTANGELIEDTYDWFAQDTDGNVWYLGEETAEYENGEVASTAGSWEAGVDGALPGIIMLADPHVGDAYRQEYYPGEAEDLAQVVRTGEAATVPSGSYDGLVVVKEWNPLEPEAVEEKYYAAGVGAVLEMKIRGGTDRVELVAYTPGT